MQAVADAPASSSVASPAPSSRTERVQAVVAVAGLVLALLGGLVGTLAWYNGRVASEAKAELEQQQVQQGLRELTQEVQALRGEVAGVRTQVGELKGMVTIVSAMQTGQRAAAEPAALPPVAVP